MENCSYDIANILIPYFLTNLLGTSFIIVIVTLVSHINMINYLHNYDNRNYKEFQTNNSKVSSFRSDSEESPLPPESLNSKED